MTTFAALDVETANPDHASICQIGVVTFSGDGTVWLAVADGLSLTTNTPVCGLVYSSGGHWTAVMINMPSGYRAAFVVVY